MKIVLILTTFIGLTVGEHLRHREIMEADFEAEELSPLSYNGPNEVNQSVKELADPMTKRSTATCLSFPGFVFWPGYDSPQYDIGHLNNPADLASMIASCTSNSNCKGLNTNGWWKKYIQPLRNWVKWPTSVPCQGLYIKIPTTFEVNGHALDATEVTNLKWIAQWTVPNFGMSRFEAIRDYIARGTWWSLKEQVLYSSNAFDFSFCNFHKWTDKHIGPLEACPSGRSWQVGIAAVQVPFDSVAIEQRASTVFGQDLPTILSRSAQQAGYNTKTREHNAIIQATGDLKKAWLLKSDLVGFYIVKDEVYNNCLISRPKDWCYGNYGGTCPRCTMYAPDAASIPKLIDEVMVLIQSLVNGA